jgi:hypothetical protein
LLSLRETLLSLLHVHFPLLVALVCKKIVPLFYNLSLSSIILMFYLYRMDGESKWEKEFPVQSALLETHKGYLSGCSLKPRDIY